LYREFDKDANSPLILKGKRMKKLQINIILSVLLSSLLLKADTVEDLTAEPVENLSPSVISMPEVLEETETTVALHSSSTSEGKAKSSNVEVQSSDKSSLETVNGKIQRRVAKSSDSSVTKEDEEAPEAENLEPAGVDNL